MDSHTAPKVFWKYFDLYRRRVISLNEYSDLTCIPEAELLELLKELGYGKKERMNFQKKCAIVIK